MQGNVRFPSICKVRSGFLLFKTRARIETKRKLAAGSRMHFHLILPHRCVGFRQYSWNM